MVAFQDEPVTASQRVLDLHGGSAQVGRDAETQPGLGFGHGDRHRVGGVMGRDQGVEPQLSDFKREPGPVRLNHLVAAKQLPTSETRTLGHHQRRAVRSGEDTGAARVVAVLVCQHDGGNGAGFNADQSEPAREFTAAEARVHQDTRHARAHDDRVAAAAASQNREVHAGQRPNPDLDGAVAVKTLR